MIAAPIAHTARRYCDRLIEYPAAMNSTAASLSDAILATDRRHFMHPGTHASDHSSGELEGRLMRRASGIRIEDHAGRSYIDAFAGLA